VVYRPSRRTYDSDLAEAQLSIIALEVREIRVNVKGFLFVIGNQYKITSITKLEPGAGKFSVSCVFRPKESSIR